MPGRGDKLTFQGRRSAAKCAGPIAIVGAACRFPGGDGLEAFWQLLIGGKDAVSAVESDRWATRFFYHPHRTEPELHLGRRADRRYRQV